MSFVGLRTTFLDFPIAIRENPAREISRSIHLYVGCIIQQSVYDTLSWDSLGLANKRASQMAIAIFFWSTSSSFLFVLWFGSCNAIPPLKLVNRSFRLEIKKEEKCASLSFHAMSKLNHDRLFCFTELLILSSIVLCFCWHVPLGIRK